MRRIVLDMKGGLLAEAVMQSLSGCDPDFLVYRSSKPEETLALCRTCRANVLVMEVIRQGIWKLSERLKLCNAVKQHQKSQQRQNTFYIICKIQSDPEKFQISDKKLKHKMIFDILSSEMRVLCREVIAL